MWPKLQRVRRTTTPKTINSFHLTLRKNVNCVTTSGRCGHFILKDTWLSMIYGQEPVMDPGFQGHFSELVARERSGHTAVVEGHRLYVWGGYMVRNTHPCQPISAQRSSSAAYTTIDTTIDYIYIKNNKRRRVHYAVDNKNSNTS